jgi:protein tyrosine/serine phosphatase
MRIPIRQVRAAAVAILATLTLSLNTSAQTIAAAPTIGIDNFAKVNDSYFRGAQPLGSDYADLAALGVKTIINLTSGDDTLSDEQTLAEQHGMRYVHIPMSTRRAPTNQELATFLGVVSASTSQPVYVHCVGGRHRTGVMTAVYRMTRDGLSGEQAFKEMKQFKFGPDFLHPEFKRFVYEFDAKRASVAANAGS